jgi:hypothetical protein
MRKLPLPSGLRSARLSRGGLTAPSHCGRPMLRLRESGPWKWGCQLCSYRRAGEPSPAAPLDEGPKAA